MKTTSVPHDATFKSLLTHPTPARDLFEVHLSADPAIKAFTAEDTTSFARASSLIRLKS